jgi:hypothetical protein
MEVWKYGSMEVKNVLVLKHFNFHTSKLVFK